MQPQEQKAPARRAMPLFVVAGAGCLMSCLCFGVLALVALSWGWREFSGVSDPWIENSYVSPDGRHGVYLEGRSNFLDLEGRVSVGVAGNPSLREPLTEWSESLPQAEWVSDREFAITLGRGWGRGHAPLRRTWNELRYTIEGD